MKKTNMTVKLKILTAGIIILLACFFLYFTVRYEHIERDIIKSLIITTNGVIREYHVFEKRIVVKKSLLNTDDLSEFLKLIHRKHADMALLAITDQNLSVRLSSKNDRFIKTTALFEKILKDFTTESFHIKKNKPYTVRYYDEKIGGKIEQLKFYIFLGKIGDYRLLMVYPFKLTGKILLRTILEIVLMVVVILILTVLVFIVITGKKHGDSMPLDGIIIDLGDPALSGSIKGGGFAGESSNVVTDTLSKYIYDQFRRIHQACNTQSVSLYIFHQTGKLVKTMELKGMVFLKIDSVSFDTINIENEVGRELRNGSTMLFDDGRTLLLPLLYHGSFLGVINLQCRVPLMGEKINEIKIGMEAILKNINDFLAINDVMTDSETGLHSKIFFHLKYNDLLKSWKKMEKHFSMIFIDIFSENVQIGDNAKNTIIKLLVPAITRILNNEGSICRYDERIALILNDINARKAENLARELGKTLASFRIKISEDTSIAINPSFSITSTDSAGKDTDMLAEGLKG